MTITALTVIAKARALNLEFSFETCQTHSFEFNSGLKWNASIRDGGRALNSWDVMDEFTLWDALIQCIRRRVEYELALMTSDRRYI